MYTIPGPGPLIPPSVLNEVDYIGYLRCSTIISNITDGTATLKNGHLYNINNPINPKDAVTKSYADSATVGGIPNLPYNSIQFNNGGSFGSSADLTFNGTTTTYAKNMRVGPGPGPDPTDIIIVNDLISGLLLPISINDVANKQFVDNEFKLNIITSTGPGLTYTAANMSRTLLYRTLSTSGPIIDTTADSTSIISYLNALSVTSVPFIVKNISSSDDYILNIAPGTGVTIIPGPNAINIWPGYEMKSELIVIGTSVSMSVTAMNYVVPSTSNFIESQTNSISNVTYITRKMAFNTEPNVLVTQNVAYGPKNIQGVIYRNYSGLKTDTLGIVSNFINGYAFPNSTIDYIFSTGAVEFIIKNTSSTGSVLLTTTSGSGWTLDPNSNMTIKTGQTGYFYLYVDVTALTGNVYTIGIFDTI